MFADRVLSGMRPTGRMHLGHYHGALKNWVRLQEEYECLYFAADWHALTTHYDTPETIAESVWEMFVDWLAVGINPNRATIFIQSRVPEHAELALLLGMITPVGWLERVPTYKDQQEKLSDRDLSTYGFLGYPVMQAADILVYRANMVPGRRGPGVAPRGGARAGAPLQSSLRPRARIRGQGQGGDQEARIEAGQALRAAAHRVPGAGRPGGAGGGAGAGRRGPESRPGRPRAPVRLSRGVAPRHPARTAAAAHRDAQGAGPRRPEDVQVLRQRDPAARGARGDHAQDPHHADRPGAGAPHPIREHRKNARCGRCIEIYSDAVGPGLGAARAAPPPASAASSASSR